MIPVGFILGLAILNDPLMYLPVLIVFLFLAFSCLTSGGLRKDQFRNVIFLLLGAGSVLLAFGGYLIITGSLDEFIQQGTLFNIQVYSKYSGLTPSITPFLQAIITGFDLFSPSVRAITDPYYGLSIFTFLDNWIFTAFLPHLAIIALIIVLLIRKKFLSATFIYLLACALYSRGGNYFHLSAFMLCAIAASSFLVYEFLLAFFEIWNNRPTKGTCFFINLR